MEMPREGPRALGRFAANLEPGRPVPDRRCPRRPLHADGPRELVPPTLASAARATAIGRASTTVNVPVGTPRRAGRPGRCQGRALRHPQGRRPRPRLHRPPGSTTSRSGSATSRKARPPRLLGNLVRPLPRRDARDEGPPADLRRRPTVRAHRHGVRRGARASGEFAKETGLVWTQAFAGKISGGVAASYLVRAIPATFLVGPDGPDPGQEPPRPRPEGGGAERLEGRQAVRRRRPGDSTTTVPHHAVRVGKQREGPGRRSRRRGPGRRRCRFPGSPAAPRCPPLPDGIRPGAAHP